jgi:hypothetical protein
MKKLCPQCRKIVDFTAASCDGCHYAFVKTRSAPKHLAGICLRIGGLALIASVIVLTIVLHH